MPEEIIHKRISDLDDYDSDVPGQYFLIVDEAIDQQSQRLPLSKVLLDGSALVLGFVKTLETSAELPTKGADFAKYLHIPGEGIYKYYPVESPPNPEHLTIPAVDASDGGKWGLTFVKVAASQVTETAEKRFASDAEKENWNGKANAADVFDKAVSDGRYVQQAEKDAANGIPTLDAGGKIKTEQLPASVMEHKGVWNAATNTPLIADGAGDNGDRYTVTGAAEPIDVDLGSGIISVSNGDAIIYNGATEQWEVSGGTDAVRSVNGFVGDVALTTEHIPEAGGLEFFTEAKARAAIQSTDVVISFDPLTGNIGLNNTPIDVAEVANDYPWDVSAGFNASIVVPAGAKTLTVTNLGPGEYCMLIVKRDAVGGAATLALTGNIVDTDDNTVDLPAAANAKVMLSGYNDGTEIHWIIKPVK